jgi:hypothetical protein
MHTSLLYARTQTSTNTTTSLVVNSLVLLTADNTSLSGELSITLSQLAKCVALCLCFERCANASCFRTQFVDQCRRARSGR